MNAALGLSTIDLLLATWNISPTNLLLFLIVNILKTGRLK